MSKVTKELIEHYAHLAKFTLQSNTELQYIMKEIELLDEKANRLNEINTEGVEPTYFGNNVYTELSEDDEKLVKNVDEPRLEYIDAPMLSEISEEKEDRF